MGTVTIAICIILAALAALIVCDNFMVAEKSADEKDFVIDPSDKFFPEADSWMWTYCTFLGKYVDPDGKKWDLGILLDNGCGKWCAACVYGNEDGNYVSGSADMYDEEKRMQSQCGKNNPFIEEMIRRAKILNLIK